MIAGFTDSGGVLADVRQNELLVAAVPADHLLLHEDVGKRSGPKDTSIQTTNNRQTGDRYRFRYSHSHVSLLNSRYASTHKCGQRTHPTASSAVMPASGEREVDVTLLTIRRLHG